MVTKLKKHSTLFIVAVILLIQPIIYNYFIQPRFKDIVIKNAENEAIKVGKHLSKVIPFSEDLNSEQTRELRDIQKDLEIRKIKIFNSKGEVTYSTALKDIGTKNEKPYFVNNVMKGEVYTQVVQKFEETMEGEIFNIDVTETYVPYLNGSNFMGAFEIYYNITKNIALLDENVTMISTTQYLITIFLALLFIILYWSKQSLSLEHEKIQEDFIHDLQEQVDIKTTELQVSMDEVVKATNSRSSFMTSISHELRNPIHAIMSCSKFALDAVESANKEKISKNLTRIKNSSHSLLETIEDILLLTSLDSGQTQVYLKRTDLMNSMKTVSEYFQNKDNDSSINLTIGSTDRHYYSMVDPKLLSKAVSNLVINAVKMSDDDSIVGVDFNEDKQHNEILIWHKVSESHLEEANKIINLLKSNCDMDDLNFSSSIGVAIAKKIVAANGGTLSAEITDNILTFKSSLDKIRQE